MKQKNISSTKPKVEAQPIQRYSIIEGCIRQSLDLPIDSSEVLSCPYGNLYNDSDECQIKNNLPKDNKERGD